MDSPFEDKSDPRGSSVQASPESEAGVGAQPVVAARPRGPCSLQLSLQAPASVGSDLELSGTSEAVSPTFA